MSHNFKRSLARPKRELSDLEAAARHISYELRMLFHSVARLGGWHASPMAPVEDDNKNMALECFLLHFRNLRAFLCPFVQSFSDDDIIASDLLGELEARDVSDAAILSKDKKRLNKMLPHLSYSRNDFIEEQDYGWQTGEMEVALLEQLEVFFAALQPDRRAWFPAESDIAIQKARAASMIAAVPDQTTMSVTSTGRL